MIEFKDSDYTLEVLKWAAENNCAQALTDKFEYLAQYGTGECIAEIYRDFAPNSFVFLMKRADGTVWFHGGLIYSGPGQPLDGSAPALTVSLDKTGHEHRWSVHT
jgi:hypothetical protein